MIRLLFLVACLAMPGAAMAQYYQQRPVQQQIPQFHYQPPNYQPWQPYLPGRSQCTTIYGRGAGGQVIATQSCN